MKKRADQLKRGDVVTSFEGASSAMCPAVAVRNYLCGSAMFHTANGKMVSVMIGYAQEVEVESHLTPAQEHAEELLTLARKVSAAGINPPPGTLAHIAAELLAKIDPPQAPTYEEALQALAELHSSTSPGSEPRWSYATEGRVRDILDRARRTGKLP